MKSVALILLVLVCKGFAASKVCTDVASGDSPSQDPTPYSLNVFPQSSDGTYWVKLDTEAKAKGFTKTMLMAFEVDNYDEPIGKFSKPSSYLKIVNCHRLKNVGVTQTGSFLPRRMTHENVYWTPSQEFHGAFKFRATFVQNDEVYWKEVESEIFTIEGPTTPSTNPTSPSDGPTSPSDEPTTPSDEPTSPSDGPTSPSDEPTSPSDEPTTPSTNPTSPSDEPTTPSDEPTTPGGGSRTANTFTSLILFCVALLLATPEILMGNFEKLIKLL